MQTYAIQKIMKIDVYKDNNNNSDNTNDNDGNDYNNSI